MTSDERNNLLKWNRYKSLTKDQNIVWYS